MIDVMESEDDTTNMSDADASADAPVKVASPTKEARKGSLLTIKVSEEEDEFREANYSDVENVLSEKILCTSCGYNLKPDVETGGIIYYHPHLKVLLCENCSNNYGDGGFSLDEDGTDKYCRWCGNGGSLYCCSKCVCAFCKKCVRRNFNRAILQDLDSDDWKCFICQPQPLFQSRAICYAAVECARKRKRLKKENKKQKVKELAEKRRTGIKPKRLERSVRLRKSSDSDIEVLESSESASNLTQKSTHQSKVSDKVVKRAVSRQSSEDLTDSDFEPKKSQRVKLSTIKEERKCSESRNECSQKIGKMDTEKGKGNKTKPKPSEFSSSKVKMLLEDMLDDMGCISGVLSEKVQYFKRKYFSEKSCTQDLLIAALHSMIRRAQLSIESLSKVEKGLKKLGKEFESEKSSPNGLQESETIMVLESDEVDSQIDTSVPTGSPNLEQASLNGKYDSTAKRCGSTSSDGADGVGSHSEGAISPTRQEDIQQCLENLSEEHNRVDPNDSCCDLFADETFNEKESDQNIAESVSTTINQSEDHGQSSCEEHTSQVPICQSHKSLSMKAGLLGCSSSDSDSETKDASSDSSNSPLNKKQDRHSEVFSEGLPQDSHRSLLSKARFNIKNLDVYHSDIKLQETCSVKIEKMDQTDEKNYVEKVGDYYDSISSHETESDHSVDNLTNLHNLKRKRKGSVNSSEDSAEVALRKKMDKSKNLKVDSEDVKPTDFFNRTSGDALESSFENSEKEIASNLEEQTPGLNNAQKNKLLRPSDSEASDNEIRDEVISDEPSPTKQEKKSKECDKIVAENVKKEKDCESGKESDHLSDSNDKKKWRRNKLLTEKLSDTDTSDEERLYEKRKAKQEERNVSSDDDDDITWPKNRKSQTPSKSNTSQNIGDTDDTTSSEDFVKKKRKVITKKSTSSSSESDKSETKRKKKRRRIQKRDSSSSSDENNTTKNSESPVKGRKKIRHVIHEDELEEGTKNAAKEEEDRRIRIAARQKMYDELYENVQKGFEVLDRLVLDFDEKTKEPLVEVDEVLVKKLKPHQVKGVKFMWDACFESLKRINSSKGSGCILAHCMGLGKTFQVITLVHTLLKYPETKVNTVLVVCPVSTVLNWVSEFHKWLSGVKEKGNIEVFELTRCKQNADRSYKLREWMEEGGVMIIGYDMYRNLSNPDAKKFRPTIMKSFQQALVNPGPDLVICDEGHLLKNEDTAISRAMTKIRTLRRIILTGTPLQNNLKEYHCMVQFVKPNLLGTRKEFLNRFVNPITNGQFEDSTSHDVKRMKRRAHVLHKTLEGSVQRFDYSVLTPFLPAKQEYVISVRLTEQQEKLYKHYLENYSSRGYQGKGAQLFADFQQLQRIWTHPRVLKMSAERNEMKAEKEDEDSEGSLRDFIDDGDENSNETSSESSDSSSEDDDDVVCLSDGSGNQKKKTKESKTHGRRTRSNKEIPSDPEPPPPRKEAEWWETFLQEGDLEDLRASPKLVLLFSILKDCEENGEKLLVFSQSLFSLDVIEYFLYKIDDATQRGVKDESLDGHQGSWSPGIDYFRLDGQTPAETRSVSCKIFNKTENLKARLFLISTRAGGLGINLVAANRVIIFDASWNPSHDVQSIFRVYRFGQKKPCFIYRFLAQGTMEEKIYERQVTKLSLACRVVDELQIERYYKMADLQELYHFTPADRAVHVMPKLPRDYLFAEILKRHDTLITTYHEHDSLLENKEEEELNEDERQAAWEDYENEKKGSANQGAAFNLGEPLPTEAQLQEVLRTRHPEKTDDQVADLAKLALKQMFVQRNQQIIKQQQQQQAQILLQNQYQQRVQQLLLQQALGPQAQLLAQQQLFQQGYQMPNFMGAGNASAFPSTSNAQYYQQIRPSGKNVGAAPQAYMPNPFSQAFNKKQ